MTSKLTFVLLMRYFMEKFIKSLNLVNIMIFIVNGIFIVIIALRILIIEFTEEVT